MTLPNAQQAVVDRDARFTRPWLKWFAELDRKLLQAGNSQSDVDAAIEAIARVLGSPDGSVDNIPDQSTPAFVIQSPDGTIGITGTPESGAVLLRLRTEALSTDQIAEGTTNKYFTDERAQDAVAALIAAGTHTGITFTYDDAGNALSATVTATGGSTDIRDVWLFG